MTNATIRYLHLSDFHVGKDGWAQQRLFDKIVAHVKSQVEVGQCPDLVFITGDLSNGGKKSEYETFRSDFFRPLEEALGGASWKGGIYVVPGNHDLARPKPDVLNRASAVAPGSRFFDPTPEGRTARDQVIPRFRQFKQLAPCNATSDWVATPAGAFRVAFEHAGFRIGIVGINTAWLSMDDHDQGKLTLGLPLLEESLRQLGDCDLRIILGHHPLSWIREDEQSRTRALLGHWNALYFHGHMHKADVRREDGSGQDFLTFQAGAAFQARDDQIWRNGLTWGEIDLSAHEVRQSPRFWNPENYDWPVETGRFPEKLRKAGTDWWVWKLPGQDPTTRALTNWQAPNGWMLFSASDLLARRRTISAQTATRFFSGAEPDWEIALATEIAPRAVVSTLIGALQANVQSDRPSVVLLTGPGGEGKSTALRQALTRLAEADPSTRVLWHQDVQASLDPDSICNIPATGDKWIVASDNADLVSSQLHRTAQALAAKGRGDVRFLLAARDSDWRAAGGLRIDWRYAASFQEVILSGVSISDARLIASSWQRLEHPEVAPVPEEVERVATELVAACSNEASDHEGALLGGMLALRFGSGLRDHVKSLLLRLESIKLSSGQTLASALALIATMHAEQLDFLSRPVLAEALGLDLSDLQSQVVFPLAREAAAGGGGGTLLRTRHRRIAAEICDVLNGDLGHDNGKRFLALARAAMRARRRGPVPDMASWHYALPQHFMKRDAGLAVDIAKMIYSEAPGNAWFAVNLGRIYRESGQPDLAERVFINFPERARADRSFWFEWATCAGSAGNPEVNAVLAGWSIADHPSLQLPENDHAKRALAGLGVTFSALHNKYGGSLYLEGRGAVGQLGLMLSLDPATRAFCKAHVAAAREAGIPQLTPDDAIAKLQNAIGTAWAAVGRAETLPEEVPSPETMTFAGLRYRLSVDKPSRGA